MPEDLANAVETGISDDVALALETGISNASATSSEIPVSTAFARSSGLNSVLLMRPQDARFWLPRRSAVLAVQLDRRLSEFRAHLTEDAVPLFGAVQKFAIVHDART